MKGRASIEKDGTLTLTTSEGTFEQGKVELAALLEELAARGIRVENVRPPEQHRHDETQTHTHTHQEGQHHVS